MSDIGSCAKAKPAEARARSKLTIFSLGNNICRKGESYES